MRDQIDKIRLVLMVDSLFVGGTERHVLALLNGLKAHPDIQTFLIIVNPGGPLDKEAISLANAYLETNRQTCSSLTLLPKLIRQIRQARGTLIHSYGWMANVLGLAIGKALRIPNINGSIRDAIPGIWHHRICQLCAFASQAVVANSQNALSTYGLDNHVGATVIHNGISLQRFKHVVPAIVQSPTLCMVANFSDKKDQSIVIESLPMIQQHIPNASLVLVGRDAGTLKHNQNLAKDLQLESSVQFVTNTSEPEPYIAASNICVLISPQGEGISNSLLEYMALRRPIIATNCGGNQEVVVDGKTGFLLAEDSAEAIAEKAIWLLQNPQNANQIGAAGRERVESIFALPRMIAEYRKLYRQLKDE